MKKRSVKALCAVLCAIMLLFSLVACSEEPYDYKLENYVKVSEHWKDIVVSEEEIIARRNKHLSETLKNTARVEEILGRGAEYGDRVTVSFTFYVYDHAKGAYVEDATFSDKNCLIELGSRKYPAELEMALRGTRKDQPFDVTLMLPLDFKYTSLQGKPVKYSGSVISVSDLVYGTLTDEIVRSVSECNTVEEYEQMLYVEAEKELYYEKLVGLASVDAYPEKEVDKYTSDYVNYYSDLATKEGVTLEQYVAKKYFTELRDFHVQADSYAKSLVKSEMLLYYMARKYGITLSDAEYNERAYKYALQYGLENVAQLEGKFGSYITKQTVLMDKVQEFVVAEAKNANLGDIPA